jgi:hypothetical protein
VKRSNVTTAQVIFGTQGLNNDATTLYLAFVSNSLRLSGYSDPAGIYILTSQVFRDPSAWFHVVLTVDTTQASATNRVKLYVNGLQISGFSTDQRSSITQNSDLPINSTQSHDIGRVGTAGLYADFYLADIHFCDGTAYDASAFGEFDTNGIWQPKKFTGTYGTNGFKLDFADNSSNTATTLGKDTSGNGNNWLPNNLSVTAGAGNDSLVDVPTNYGTDTGVGGEVRGNYATWNPLSSGSTALANGNLQTSSPSGEPKALSTIAFPTSGKWYYEVTITQLVAGGGSNYGGYIGIESLTSSTTNAIAALSAASGVGGVYKNDVRLEAITSLAVNDVIGIAFDADNLTCQFYRNGSTYGSQVTGLTSATYIARLVSNNASGATNIQQTNFGQRPFAYTAPSGFKALCTANLPLPVVTKPSSVFDVKLWTGAGGTQNISGLGFSPDLVWWKNRSNGTIWHNLVDQVRGAGKMLFSNDTSAEFATNLRGTLTAFTSDGFTLTAGSSDADNSNATSVPYVGWCWDAGSSTVTNTAGSITSSVRANASAGFSIVTFNSGASGQNTIGHGLNVAPQLIITKSRTVNPSNWTTYHTSLPSLSSYLNLNSTSAVQTATGIWGTSAPTSSIFGFLSGTNQSASTDCVAYCFAPVSSYSAFGSYTGNGSSTDGPFVYTGFRPRYVLVKASSTSDVWNAVDTARDPYNAANKNLWINQSSAEDSSTAGMDILSNGFKPRTSFNYNGSGVTYIYAAFAESPFQYARAR